MIDIIQSEFGKLVEENEILVLDFWAGWCQPCRVFAPVFEEVSLKYKNICFGKVDIESGLDLSAYFQIKSIPTILVIREGIEVFRSQGGLVEADLIHIIEQVLSLDMNEVNRLVDEEDNKNS